MPALIFCFQVHQPYRLRPYTVFDLGENHLYEDAEANRAMVRARSESTYLPMNALLLDLIRQYKGAFKVSFSISGTALEQFEEYQPEVIDSFGKLAQTGQVEFISEPYAHSLACLYSREEFRKQVAQHRARTRDLFGMQPHTFLNTELVYNNDLATVIEDMGFDAIVTEGADHILGWRSPNFVYQPAHCRKLRLLLRNHQLSDDIALRFSDASWSGFPLTADTFASWVQAANSPESVISLCMDYTSFGGRHTKETGIFDFMRALPEVLLTHRDFCFMTPAEAAASFHPAAKIDVPHYISWADAERDLTTWLGNDMQLDAIEALYKLEDKATAAASPDLLKVWRRLQNAEHFYYMNTKWLSDGDAHKRFNPYNSPYDAYINFMNVLADFELTVSEAAALTKESAAPAVHAPAQPLAEARVALPADPEHDLPSDPMPGQRSQPAKAEPVPAATKKRTANPKDKAAPPTDKATKPRTASKRASTPAGSGRAPDTL